MPVERVLFVNQGITPYVEASYESKIGRDLPISILEKGVDARIFMPKYGFINDKKSFLHEVIRLSSQNLVVNTRSRPLIIKVTSIPTWQRHIYFVYNEYYFDRMQMMTDPRGMLFSDNDERAIFYACGVFETIRNLGWSPDIIHCHGWISCLVPLLLKKFYSDNPLFSKTKVVYSVYADHAKKSLSLRFGKKLNELGIPLEDASRYRGVSYETALKLAIDYSDGVVIAHEKVSKEIREHIAKVHKPTIEHRENKYGNYYLKLYNRVYK